MDESKECRAGFDKITKGLEKQGYTDWKNWVLKQVENYTDEQLQNLIKRTEIKLEIADEDRGLTAPDMMKFHSVRFQAVIILNYPSFYPICLTGLYPTA